MNITKTIANIAAAASIGLAAGAVGILATAPKAEAAPGGNCYAHTAAIDIDKYLLGGATPHEAVSYVYQDGLFDGTKQCIHKISGIVNQMPYGYQGWALHMGK